MRPDNSHLFHDTVVQKHLLATYLKECDTELIVVFRTSFMSWFEHARYRKKIKLCVVRWSSLILGPGCKRKLKIGRMTEEAFDSSH